MTISIEHSNPEKDGKAILELLTETYGKYYDKFYETDEFSSGINKGTFISLVAKNKEEVIGHHGAYISPDFSKVVALAIKPTFRGQGLSKILEKKMQEEILSRHSIKYVYGEIVANHTITQKAKFEQGFLAIGFYSQRHPLNRPHSVIPSLWDIYGSIKKEKNPTINICKHYENIAKVVYAQFGSTVQNNPKETELPRTDTTYTIKIFEDNRSTTHLSPGRDLHAAIENIAHETSQKGVKHNIINLDAEQLCTPLASTILREYGYSFGSIRPRLQKTPATLTLQKITDCKKNEEEIINPYEQIVQMVRKELQSGNTAQ